MCHMLTCTVYYLIAVANIPEHYNWSYYVLLGMTGDHWEKAAAEDYDIRKVPNIN